METLHHAPRIGENNSTAKTFDHETLTEIIRLSLWAGQLLLQYGAPSQTVEETVHHIGTGLGCTWMDITVLTNSITVTAITVGDFRTKVRRVVKIGVNMQVICDVNELSRRIDAHQLNTQEVYSELRAISDKASNYRPEVVIILVGLACAAFSRLFGGDLTTFLVTFASASLAMFVRQTLSKQFVNTLLIVFLTAFTAGIGASIVHFLGISSEIALTSSVLLLVPGVPLINAAEDLIEGHIETGMSRGLSGALTALVLALGLISAMHLMKVSL